MWCSVFKIRELHLPGGLVAIVFLLNTENEAGRRADETQLLHQHLLGIKQTLSVPVAVSTENLMVISGCM